MNISNTLLQSGLMHLGASMAGTELFNSLHVYFGSLCPLLKYKPVFPDFVRKSVQFIAKEINYVRSFGSRRFCSLILMNSIVEELFFRNIVQEIFLRRLPLALLNTVAPSYSVLVDSSVAKVARIIVSSSLFTLAHVNNKDDDGNYQFDIAYAVDLLVWGAVYGALQETQKNPFLAIIYHTGTNMVPYANNLSVDIKKLLDLKKEIQEERKEIGDWATHLKEKNGV